MTAQISRRQFALSAAAAYSATLFARMPNSASVEDALQATFPLYETARLANAQRSRFNQLNHRRTLSDHTHQAVTMPNNDTLYSSCWMDLAAAAIELDIAPLERRYQSVAIMDAFTDNIAVLHPGQETRRILVVGPTWTGDRPRNRELVRLGTNYAWLLGRTCVAGTADLASARVAQDGLVVRAIPNAGPRSVLLTREVPVRPDAGQYLSVVNAALHEISDKHPLKKPMTRFRHLGLGVEASGSVDLAHWTGALEKFAGRMAQESVRYASIRSGWSWPDKAIGKFGSNIGFRAATALSGIGALPNYEAVYLTAVSDSEGAPVSAGSRYRLDCPPDGEIAEAFWSLSAYEAQPDGRFFFSPNAIDRFAIGSGTDGLVQTGSGTRLLLQSDRPRDDAANWLPIPLGPFRLVFRAYKPTGKFRQGKVLIPPLIRV